MGIDQFTRGSLTEQGISIRGKNESRSIQQNGRENDLTRKRQIVAQALLLKKRARAKEGGSWRAPNP